MILQMSDDMFLLSGRRINDNRASIASVFHLASLNLGSISYFPSGNLAASLKFLSEKFY